jgi:hypothetical protein
MTSPLVEPRLRELAYDEDAQPTKDELLAVIDGLLDQHAQYSTSYDYIYQAHRVKLVAIRVLVAQDKALAARPSQYELTEKDKRLEVTPEGSIHRSTRSVMFAPLGLAARPSQDHARRVERQDDAVRELTSGAAETVETLVDIAAYFRKEAAYECENMGSGGSTIALGRWKRYYMAIENVVWDIQHPDAISSPPDTALREAAKAQAERLTSFRAKGCFEGLGYIPRDDIDATIKWLERFAGGC